MAFKLPEAIMKVYQSLLTVKIVITSPETRAEVNTHWGNCTAWLKQNKAATDLLKAPFKKEIKDIDDANNPMRERVEAMESAAQRAIIAWDQKERMRIQNSNTGKLGKYEVKAATVEAKAISQGKPVPHVPMPALEQEPAKTVVVGDLKTTTVERTDWWMAGVPQPVDDYGLFCGDPSKTFKGFTAKDNEDKKQGIPSEYFILDTARVGKVMRAGGPIPGIDAVKVYGLSGKQA